MSILLFILKLSEVIQSKHVTAVVSSYICYLTNGYSDHDLSAIT